MYRKIAVTFPGFVRTTDGENVERLHVLYHVAHCGSVSLKNKLNENYTAYLRWMTVIEVVSGLMCNKVIKIFSE